MHYLFLMIATRLSLIHFAVIFPNAESEGGFDPSQLQHEPLSDYYNEPGPGREFVDFYLAFHKYLKTSNQLFTPLHTIVAGWAMLFYSIADGLQYFYVRLFGLFDLTSNGSGDSLGAGPVQEIQQWYHWCNEFGTVVFLLVLACYVIAGIFNGPTYKRWKEIMRNFVVVTFFIAALPQFTSDFAKGCQSIANATLGNRMTTGSGTGSHSLAQEIFEDNTYSLPIRLMNLQPGQEIPNDQHSVFFTQSSMIPGADQPTAMIDLMNMPEDERNAWNGLGERPIMTFLTDYGDSSELLDKDEMQEIEDTQAKLESQDKNKSSISRVGDKVKQTINNAPLIGGMLSNMDRNDADKSFQDVFEYHLVIDGGAGGSSNANNLLPDYELDQFKQFAGITHVTARILDESYEMYDVHWFAIFGGLLMIIAIMATYIYKIFVMFYKLVIMYVTSGLLLFRNVDNTNTIKSWVRDIFSIYEMLIIDVISIYMVFVLYEAIHGFNDKLVYTHVGMGANPVVLTIMDMIADLALYKTSLKGITSINNAVGSVGGGANTGGMDLAADMIAADRGLQLAKGAGRAVVGRPDGHGGRQGGLAGMVGAGGAMLGNAASGLHRAAKNARAKNGGSGLGPFNAAITRGANNAKKWLRKHGANGQNPNAASTDREHANNGFNALGGDAAKPSASATSSNAASRHTQSSGIGNAANHADSSNALSGGTSASASASKSSAAASAATQAALDSLNGSNDSSSVADSNQNAADDDFGGSDSDVNDLGSFDDEPTDDSSDAGEAQTSDLGSDEAQDFADSQDSQDSDSVADNQSSDVADNNSMQTQSSASNSDALNSGYQNGRQSTAQSAMNQARRSNAQQNRQASQNRQSGANQSQNQNGVIRNSAVGTAGSHVAGNALTGNHSGGNGYGYGSGSAANPIQKAHTQNAASNVAANNSSNVASSPTSGNGVVQNTQQANNVGGNNTTTQANNQNATDESTTQGQGHSVLSNGPQPVGSNGGNNPQPQQPAEPQNSPIAPNSPTAPQQPANEPAQPNEPSQPGQPSQPSVPGGGAAPAGNDYNYSQPSEPGQPSYSQPQAPTSGYSYSGGGYQSAAYQGQGYQQPNYQSPAYQGPNNQGPVNNNYSPSGYTPQPQGNNFGSNYKPQQGGNNFGAGYSGSGTTITKNYKIEKSGGSHDGPFRWKHPSFK